MSEKDEEITCLQKSVDHLTKSNESVNQKAVDVLSETLTKEHQAALLTQSNSLKEKHEAALEVALQAKTAEMASQSVADKRAALEDKQEALQSQATILK